MEKKQVKATVYSFVTMDSDMYLYDSFFILFSYKKSHYIVLFLELKMNDFKTQYYKLKFIFTLYCMDK